MGLKVKRKIELPIIYNDIKLESGYKIDLLVEDKLISELKSIEEIHPVHHKQVLTYL